MNKFITYIVLTILMTGCSQKISETIDVQKVEASQSKVVPDDSTKNKDIKKIETTATPKTTVPITHEPTKVEATPKVETVTEPKEKVVSSSALVHETDYSKNEKLSNEKKSWYFNRNANHQPPTAQKDIDLKKFDAYYLGDTSEKSVYLTFDQGYENGYTNTILDILKEENVKATFFLTKPYIKNNIEIVKRMIADGHTLANHSVTHPSLPTISDKKVIFELEETKRYLEEMTGYSMDMFFRPPMGEYSERTLGITRDLGYKTIFWSFAYKDWLVDAQPTKEVAYKTVMDNLHNGSIILLHSVSSANTSALKDIIQSIKNENFGFCTLYELQK